MPAYLSPMTPQDEATLMLLDWQADRAKRMAMRERTPSEAAEALLANCFAPFKSEDEYLEELARIEAEMSHDD